jgi:NSS family neurotransmitter:Na+ symporter
VQDPEKQLFWHALFLVATLLVSARGVARGLEPAARYAVPWLFVLLVVLAAYALSLGDPLAALAPVFAFDFTRLDARAVVHAAAHAFFSLGLGAGVLLMYGAYLGPQARVGRLAAAVAAADTGVSLVAAALVFAVLAAGGVAAATGPALVFQAMPLAFDHVPLGRLFVILFYTMLAVAAWLSAIALAEPAVAWLAERFALRRARAAAAVGIAAWVPGVAVILSFNEWAFAFEFFGALKTLGFFDILQIATAVLMLPLVGILLALFAGWIVPQDDTRQWLVFASPCIFDAWLWLVRLVLPFVLLIVMFHLPRLFA